MPFCNPEKSIPCGKSCIKKTFTCHKDIIPNPRRNCNPEKSIPCGKSCIKKTFTCHKDSFPAPDYPDSPSFPAPDYPDSPTSEYEPDPFVPPVYVPFPAQNFRPIRIPNDPVRDDEYWSILTELQNSDYREQSFNLFVRAVEVIDPHPSNEGFVARMIQVWNVARNLGADPTTVYQYFFYHENTRAMAGNDDRIIFVTTELPPANEAELRAQAATFINENYAAAAA